MRFQDPSSLGLTTLERHTDGNGCGYLHTPYGMSGENYDGHGSELGQQIKRLPTPRKCDGEKGTRSPEGHAKERERRGNGVDLPTAMAMLPTPRSGKTTDETEWAWTARQKAGKVSTPPLSLAINMAPTPSASMVTMQDFVQAKFHSSKRQKYSEAMLPMPTKQDGENNGGASQYERNTPPLNAVVGPKAGLKLQPAFVEHLMGWPIGWSRIGGE